MRDTGLTDVVFKGFVSDEDKIRYYQQLRRLLLAGHRAREPGRDPAGGHGGGEAGDRLAPSTATAPWCATSRTGSWCPRRTRPRWPWGCAGSFSDAPLRRRLAEAGHAKAQAYSWAKVARRLLGVYDEADLRVPPAQPGRAAPAPPHRPPMTASVRPPPAPRRPRRRILTASWHTERTWPPSAPIAAAEPAHRRAHRRPPGPHSGDSQRAHRPRPPAQHPGRAPPGLAGRTSPAALLVLVAGAFDMLDGALARVTNRKTVFGGVLRLHDRPLLRGRRASWGSRWPSCGTHGRRAGRRRGRLVRLAGVVLCYVVAINSLLVSYTRARAEVMASTARWAGCSARSESSSSAWGSSCPTRGP